MYELVIIGAGAAGIEAAKTSAKCKLKTLLIEKDYDHFGGICLNKGCVPAKYYLNSSQHTSDLTSIYEGKNNIIETIKRPTVDYLKKQGIDIIWSEAYLASNNTINACGKTIDTKNIIIASGSIPYELIKVDKRKVFFAEDLFSLSVLPQRFLIVGAGAVGLEAASFLSNLNKDVLVIEKEEHILPGMDKFLAQRLKIILNKDGFKIKTSDNLSNYSLNNFDAVILATGRKPNSQSLGIDGVGLSCEKGWLKVGSSFKTNIGGIYACGDITGDKLLAYTASRAGSIAVNNIVGKKEKIDYCGLAQCVFTQPQVAAVGILEEEAQAKNIKYHVIKTNFLKFSSTYVYNDTNGFIEILYDDKEKIIGAAIISNLASELISLFSLAIRERITVKHLKDAIFIHPTISEIINLSLRI